MRGCRGRGRRDFAGRTEKIKGCCWKSFFQGSQSRLLSHRPVHPAYGCSYGYQGGPTYLSTSTEHGKNKLQAPFIYLPKAPESALIYRYIFFNILLYTFIVFICLQLKNVGHMPLLYRFFFFCLCKQLACVTLKAFFFTQNVVCCMQNDNHN